MSTIKKTYFLGADRLVIISDDNTEISIREQSSEGKRAFFTGRRWAEFRRQMKEIDEAAQNARDDKQVSLRIITEAGGTPASTLRYRVWICADGT